MSFEARPPTDADAPPQQAPAELATTVLTPSDTGAVSKRAPGKSGPSTTRRRTAAKRKPEAKTPPSAKKAARKATPGQGIRKRAGTAAAKKSGGWKAGPSVAGRKPSAAQKTNTKKTPARKAASAPKRAAGRVTGRTAGTPTRTGKGTRTGSARTTGARPGARGGGRR
ncbi:hypothetical protein HPC49_30310 [Pyxidicoccus fallax]|uniref:Uncharacterized protein n=1 Tax=Pyxidicoccus fallax TaxID=394095 RepID=A0A848LLK3_9BACT|nr:hypothetical protein [Pyxidicoccus fallax]NMO18591.1 hypothetical protein [Pyxidicoccus fallax]NPC82502.1 hypothetical protein [Pyxidicoccus fallax]